MGKHFSVESRETCKVCGGPITNLRSRTYCGKPCRDKYNNKVRYKRHGNKYSNEKRGLYAPSKRKCLICNRWYVQVGTHVFIRHGMTAAEYKEEFDLPTSKGVIPKWYKKKKGEIAIENETYLNLEKGKHTRYKKNDPRAVVNHGWKGRAGAKGYSPEEHGEM